MSKTKPRPIYTYENNDTSSNEAISYSTMINVTCPVHGEFKQTLYDGLRGVGCPKCAGQNKTTSEFILEAAVVHNNKYDYSKVEYINAKTKVTIICKEHGEFEQEAHSHLQSVGCPICAGKRKITTQEFVSKSIKIHGDKYDYSKVDYINAKTKVTIICKYHGEFEQVPYSHFNADGCPSCAKNKKLTTEEIIVRAKEVHGDIYDYTNVCYTGSKNKITIICKEHGKFWQNPIGHLRGRGCPKCVGNVKLSTCDFLKRAKDKHGDRYDYIKVCYTGSKNKITIICKEHGEFVQSGSNHLRGHGCPKCGSLSSINVFIKKATKVHGSIYTYDNAIYNGAEEKLTITCSLHGDYSQTPHGHLRGRGCSKCRGKRHV